MSDMILNLDSREVVSIIIALDNKVKQAMTSGAADIVVEFHTLANKVTDQYDAQTSPKF